MKEAILEVLTNPELRGMIACPQAAAPTTGPAAVASVCPGSKPASPHSATARPKWSTPR